MKTRVIIASALTVLSLGIMTSVYATSNQTEVKPVAKAVETIKTENKQEVTTPVESPVVQAPQEAPAPAEVQPIETTTYIPESELFGYVIIKVKPLIADSQLSSKLPQVTSVITQNYSAHKERFTVDSIDTTITECVDYLKSLSSDTLHIAIAKGDCGL